MFTTSLTFVRQGAFRILDTAILTITSVENLSPSEAKSKVVDAITQWINDTMEGKDAWSYSCTDFNIGDLSQFEQSSTLNNILKQHGINSINIATISADNFDFDEVLVNSHLLDEDEDE